MPDGPVPFGPFSLLNPLAQGGMGEVWLAHPWGVPGAGDLCIVKRVKTTLHGDDDVLRRFLDESRLAILLVHPHICRTLDAGRADGCDYLAADLVDGVDVKQLTLRTADADVVIDRFVAVTLAADALDGLAYAHDAHHPLTGAPLHIVHRDVSPQNIMIGSDGQARVIDFGLALSSVRQSQTEQGVVLGKLAYMSPEQARAERVDGRCDVFAMGAVLYELLVGERFWGALSTTEIWSRVGHGSHVPLRIDALDDELRPIVSAMIDPDPQRRPTAAATRDLLRAVLRRHAKEGDARARLTALIARFAAPELERAARSRVVAHSLAPTLTEMPATTMSIAVQEARAVEALLTGRAVAPTREFSAAPAAMERPMAATVPLLPAARTLLVPRAADRAPTQRPPTTTTSTGSRSSTAAVVVVVVVAVVCIAAVTAFVGAHLLGAPDAPAPPTPVAVIPAPVAAPIEVAPPVEVAPVEVAPTPVEVTPRPTPIVRVGDALERRMRALAGCRHPCAPPLAKNADKAHTLKPLVRRPVETAVTNCEKQCR